jgi:hypothetical protein
MMTKITVGGVLAGLVMFIWSFIAHMMLPIGFMGISATPGEDAVLAALKANNAGSGLYIMPGNDYFLSLSKSSAEQQAAMKAMTDKAKTSGWAMIVYHPSEWRSGDRTEDSRSAIVVTDHRLLDIRICALGSDAADTLLRHACLACQHHGLAAIRGRRFS